MPGSRVPMSEEIKAMTKIERILAHLDPQARARVIQWAGSKAWAETQPVVGTPAPPTN